MKVRGHETWVARVPYEENRAANHIVLRVRTDEGEHGISYLTPLVPWTIKPICAAIDALMERVVGRSGREHQRDASDQSGASAI